MIFLVSCVRPLVSHVRPCGHEFFSCPCFLVLICNVVVQLFFGVLSKMPCATAVNDFLGVLCATIGVSCSTKCSTMWTRIFLVLIFNVTAIWCPMLRPHGFVGLISDVHKTIYTNRYRRDPTLILLFCTVIEK